MTGPTGLHVKTTETGSGTGYDLTTSLVLLGVEQTYTLLVPPSERPGSDDSRIFGLGLWLHAGGAGASRFDGTTPLILSKLPSSHPDAVHRTGQPVGERVQRVVQRTTER